MGLFRKKPKVLKLTAPEARIIAQLKAVKIKFDREQGLLHSILYSAERGEFKWTGYDIRYFSASGIYSDGQFLGETDVQFLKQLGYVIESVDTYYRIPCEIGHDNQIISTPYTQYTVKW